MNHNTLKMVVASLAVCAAASARPHYVFYPPVIDDFDQASGQAMAWVRTPGGPRCVCAPGWIGDDPSVRAMMVEGPDAGTVFDLPGAPPMLPDPRGIRGWSGGGAGGLLAYRAMGPAGPSIAVVGPIEGPGSPPPNVAFVTGLPIDPLSPDFDFEFTPVGGLVAAVGSRTPGGKQYTLFDCFPTTWSSAPIATTSSVQCDTITAKMQRVELSLRGPGAPGSDDLFVLAGQLTTDPPVVQVAGVMRSNPQAFTVFELPGTMHSLALANGRTYLALSDVPGEATTVMQRVMDMVSPIPPEYVLRGAAHGSGLATGRRVWLPTLFSTPPSPPTTTIAAGRGAAAGLGLSLAMFDQPVLLETIRVGAMFQGRQIESYGFNPWFGLDADESGDWRDFDLFCTVQFTNGQSAIVHVADLADGCPGDADGSLTVSFADITATLAAWGAAEDPREPVPVRGDSNSDGAVTFADITTSLANFGNDCR